MEEIQIEEEFQEKPEKKKRKLNKSTKSSLIITVILAGLLFAAIFVGVFWFNTKAAYYKDHFFNGTIINQKDCSFLTAEEVEELIVDNDAEFHFTITFRNGTTATIEGEDVDFKSVSKDSIEELLAEQNPKDWLKVYMNGDVKHAELSSGYDEAKLNELLESLPEFQEDLMEAPMEAYMKFNNGTYNIVPETLGNQLNKETAVPAIKNALSQGKSSIDLNMVNGAYVEPAVKQDDQHLNYQVNYLNSLISASITYKTYQGDVTLDGNTLKDWLSVDENGNYYKDEEMWNSHIREYVNNLAGYANNVGIERPFNATDLGMITLKSNYYGTEINVESEIMHLSDDLANNVVTTRYPETYMSDMGAENYGFGKNYIECDLSRQHMWVYVDGEVVLESDIVSGTMTPDRYTPPGIFFLDYKQHTRTLRGDLLPDGTYTYQAFVDWWMDFNGGIGFHDADWNAYFGGEKYIYSGSHGCINLPGYIAEELFGIINNQMPIIVYYSQGFEFHG